MAEDDATQAYRKVAIGRAERVEELMGEIADLKANVRAVLRLISPEHITPIGKRQIEQVLDEHPRATPPGTSKSDERERKDSANESVVAAVLELLPDECYVTQTDFRCTEFIGGTIGNATFVEEMCCLPCRIRKALS